MNPLNFVAVILKVLLVNLLAALNFANVFSNKKTFGKLKNTLKRKNVTKIKKHVKTFFTSMVSPNPTRIQIRIRQIEFTALDVLLSIHNCCIIVGTLQYILCLIYQLANAKFPRSCQLWLHISVRCPQLRTS